MKVKQNKMVLALAGMMMVVMMGGCEKSAVEIQAERQNAAHAAWVAAEAAKEAWIKALHAETRKMVAYYMKNKPEAKTTLRDCNKQVRRQNDLYEARKLDKFLIQCLAAENVVYFDGKDV